MLERLPTKPCTKAQTMGGRNTSELQATLGREEGREGTGKKTKRRRDQGLQGAAKWVSRDEESPRVPQNRGTPGRLEQACRGQCQGAWGWT